MSSGNQRFVVVVGAEFSELSLAAVDEAFSAAGIRGGEVHAVLVRPEHAVENATFDDGVSYADALEGLRRHLQARLDAFTSRAPGVPPARVVAHVRFGFAAQQIAELAANLDADLVVVGSHGRQGVKRLLLGSVAEQVVRLARCPVWIVRPKDHPPELRIPEIEPPCPDCLARREATGGAALWCARHSEHHIRPHTYTYARDGIWDRSTVAYESTPEG
jgi:nucleotide-binding universal stress UspA family protein